MLMAWKRTAIAGLACLIAAPASAQLIQRKDLSYAMARTIAENALADLQGTRLRSLGRRGRSRGRHERRPFAPMTLARTPWRTHAARLTRRAPSA